MNGALRFGSAAVGDSCPDFDIHRFLGESNEGTKDQNDRDRSGGVARIRSIRDTKRS